MGAGMRICGFVLFASGLLLSASPLVRAQKEQLPKDDLTPNFKAPKTESDYEKRVEMVPMRDGTKLYTVICVPRGAHGAPIVLTLTQRSLLTSDWDLVSAMRRLFIKRLKVLCFKVASATPTLTREP